MGTSILATLALALVAVNAQFVEEVDDVGRVRRQLLQEDEYDVAEAEEQEPAVTTTTTTEEPFMGTPEAGPTRFYYQNGNLPKFLMEVDNGIELTLYREDGSIMDTFVLDQAAKGGITGSKLTNPMIEEMDSDMQRTRLIPEDYVLNLDYKNHPLAGRNGQLRLDGFMITFNFERKVTNVTLPANETDNVTVSTQELGSTWKMTNLEVVNLPINGQFHTLAMGARTVAGDKVEAPVGLSFACAEDGHFRSNRSMPVSGSLRFPGWRMQVFEVRRGQFGPMWECGELMSIGLWVGLLVTLGFTLICAWGFSMLASINTMDRFDDPKGKNIHIPQTTD